MSSVIELEADNADEATAISLLWFHSQAPIALYDTEERSTLKFPYDSKQVADVLDGM